MKMSKALFYANAPKIGAHVSAAVSLERSFDRAKDIGANCSQIFISPPQQWLQTKHGVEEIKKYNDAARESGIEPNFIHGTYLINLATGKPENLQKSIEWLKYAMNLSYGLGTEGVIFHTGSHGGVGFEKVTNQIVRSLKDILDKCPPIVGRMSTPSIILENSAGAGDSIGSKFSELGAIIKKVNNPRLKVCLDTCHLYAAGYDIKTPEGLEKTLNEFEREVGLKNLAAIHANDTKFDIGSNKDRHENIGEGFLGSNAFKNMVNHLSLQNIPFILEVPGFSDTGPDIENIQILKGLINSKKSSQLRHS